MSCLAEIVLVLRAYQEYGIRGIRGLMREGHRRVLLVGPCGSGKRYLGVWLANETQDKYRRCLIVTNRTILVKQMYDELGRFGVDYGIIWANQAENREATVQVASLQTLQSRHLETGEGLPPADLVIVDEAHASPQSYAKLFSYYPDAYIVGLTATPIGPGGTPMVGDGKLYDSLFEYVTNSQLLAQGMLLPTKFYAPSEPDMKGVTISAGDYAEGEMIQRVREVTVFADVFKAWQPFSNMQTLLFVPGVEFSRWFADEFNRRGIHAAHIEAATKMDDREMMFRDIEEGNLRVLCSVGTLREGLDVPIFQCGIDLQPTLQIRDYIQKTGRIRRPFEGQAYCVWLDMAGSFWRHGHPDQDFPWDELTGDTTTQEIQQRKRDAGDDAPSACPKCGFAPKLSARCSQCGYESTKIVRRVRMGNGKLKEMPVDYTAKKRSTSTDVQKLWDKYVSIAVYTNQTINQARAMYRKNTGEYPPVGLKSMPSPGSPDWDRKAIDVFPWKCRKKVK